MPGMQPLRRERLRRGLSGRPGRLHAGILNVQLAEKHGAEQRTPGQKENRYAIDHFTQPRSAIGTARRRVFL